MRPPGRTRGRSYTQLMLIVVFSAGILTFFLTHRSPTLGHRGGIHTADADAGQNAANRRELHLGITQSQKTSHTITAKDSSTTTSATSVTTAVGAPDAPQATISSPSPMVLVTTHDARHPENIQAIISGQSHAEENKDTMTQTMIQGRVGDGEKKKTGADSAAPAPSPNAKAANKQTSTTKAKADAGKTTSSASTSTGTTTTSAKSGTAASTSTTTSTTAKTQSSTATAVSATNGTATATTNVKKMTKERAVTSGANNPKSTAPGPGCKKAGKDCGLPGKTIHTLFTSNGSPYQNIQARIMIATWKLARAQPGGENMVALSRILHRTQPDEIMDEVDTFRADPLQPECDKWCWFPVADRANAFQQWLDAVEINPSMQKAPWLLLLETDYVWIKPLQALGDAYDPKVPGLSFAFDYIGPRGNKIVERMLKEECPDCDPNTVPNSGPAPVLARFEDFKAATPLWERLSLWIETHEDAKKALGWVREMYAWDIGVAAGRLNILNQGPPETTLIAQPPHDHLPHNATMYHYTWGSIFKDGEEQIWMFDKRKYVDPKDAYKLPKIPLPPPFKEGIVLHDGTPVTKDLHATLTHMLSLMNQGIDTLPDLTEHAMELQKRLATKEAAAKKATTAHV